MAWLFFGDPFGFKSTDEPEVKVKEKEATGNDEPINYSELYDCKKHRTMYNAEGKCIKCEFAEELKKPGGFRDKSSGL